MEPQPAKPAAVVRIPVTVPADQAGSWPKHVETICAPHGVRVKVTAEAGRSATLFIFDLRGSPEGLREAQARLQLLISAIALHPAGAKRSKRIVIAAISFALGLGAVLLLFSAAGTP